MKLGINIKNRDWKSVIWQFVKFGLVGLSNAIVLYGVYYVLLYFGVHHIVSYIIAFVISVLNAYIWNNAYVFKRSEEKVTTNKIIKIYASYTTTFLLSIVLLYLWVDCLHISDKIAPIINIILTTPINFIMNKLWTFKDNL